MAASDYQDPVSWPFLPVLQNGQMTFPSLAQSVRDSIRVILTTRPGEQLMRPRFGAGLQNFLDEGNTVSLRRQIQSAILTNLQNYETRIAVDAVDVSPVPNASSEVHVQIYYRLLRTNTTQHIGVTLQAG
jgi:phage baseplate assembly protein W